MKLKKRILNVFLFLLGANLFAQVGSLITPKIDVGFPIQGKDKIYSAPIAGPEIRVYFFNKEEAFLQYGFDIDGLIFPTITSEEMLSVEVGGLLSFYYPISNRINVRGDVVVGGGYYQLLNAEKEPGFNELYGNSYGFGPVFRTDVNFGIYTSPNVVFTAGAGLKTSPGLYNSANFTLGFSFLAPKTKSLMEVEQLQATSIIPVFYEFYSENPVFKIQVTNNERFPIRSVNLFLQKTSVSDRYIKKVPVNIQPGETKDVYFPFKIKSSVLNQQKGFSDNIKVSLKYKAGNASRKSNVIIPFTVLERNSFVWQTEVEDDGSPLSRVISANDGKVAVFVNPNDAKFVDLAHQIQSAYEEEIGFSDLNYNLKTIYKVISYLQSQNIKYQTDPNTIPVGNTNLVVDYLKFPAETLKAGFGDCDDLSLLFAQLLESSGVHCAFITTPGHIYLAADVGMATEKIASLFGDTSRFLNYNGNYYLPIEVTRVRDGFKMTWNMGLKEWGEAAIEERAFFPLEEAWREFKPVSVDLISDMAYFYPGKTYKRYQLEAKDDLVKIAMENDWNDLKTLSREEIDFLRLAKKEYSLGLLDDAYVHILYALEEKPVASVYYNAALIAYRKNAPEDALNLLLEASKINEDVKNKQLYKTLTEDSSIAIENTVQNSAGKKAGASDSRAAEAKEAFEWQE